MDDCISRQAAIDALEKVADLFPWKVPGNRDSYGHYNEAWNDAMGRAEMEIEKLPSAQPDVADINVGSNDMISRQKAVEEIIAQEAVYADDAVEIIKRLPSAQPEQKKGHYIGTEYYEWQCSECGCVFEDGKPTYNYCPNCGEEMEKVRE